MSEFFKTSEFFVEYIKTNRQCPWVVCAPDGNWLATFRNEQDAMKYVEWRNPTCLTKNSLPGPSKKTL